MGSLWRRTRPSLADQRTVSLTALKPRYGMVAGAVAAAVAGLGTLAYARWIERLRIEISRPEVRLASPGLPQAGLLANKLLATSIITLLLTIWCQIKNNAKWKPL